MNPKTKLLYGILVLIALLLPFQYFTYLIFDMKVLCFALFACAFNLLLGFTGLLSFGHAAFFGTAAYITAYFFKEAGLFPELGMILGVLDSGVLGFFDWLIGYSQAGYLFRNGDTRPVADGLLPGGSIWAVKIAFRVCLVECCWVLLASRMMLRCTTLCSPFSCLVLR